MVDTTEIFRALELPGMVGWEMAAVYVVDGRLFAHIRRIGCLVTITVSASNDLALLLEVVRAVKACNELYDATTSKVRRPVAQTSARVPAGQSAFAF